MILTLYEPFRHWSDGGSVYILSDLHFDDEDCQFMNPGWITPQEQIEIINKIVMKNDTFICLGEYMWLYTDKSWKDYQGRCAGRCSEYSPNDN